MGKLAFVFPGQGSQTVGMLDEMASENDLFYDVYNEASAVLKYDLGELLSNNPEVKLNQAECTQ